MKTLSIDFETHSRVDLKACGAYVYATDPTTGVYVMSWAFGDEPPRRWVPGDDEEFPAEVADHFARGGTITAWNAQFERLILWYVVCPDYDVPEPALEQFHCTAARARAHGMPGKLGDCARALGVKVQKMTEGSRLINTYSVHNVPWARIPREDRELWKAYCDLDVTVERAIAQPLRELNACEWHEYHLNERICDRGVPMDLAFIDAAAEYADELREGADGRIQTLTAGAVGTARQRKSRDAYFLPMLTDAGLAILTKKDGDEIKISWEQSRREQLYVHPDTPPLVRQYLEQVEEAGGASLRKYRAMRNRSIDGRLYGALLFNGAGQTGRFSSTGLQVHNLKRSGGQDVQQVVADVVEGYELDNPSQALGEAVRGAIYSREQGLAWGDWSSIEGRVAPWLADSPAGEQKLDLFRRGDDPYVLNAAATFGCAPGEVTKEQRQAGKVQELALGFLGGVGALRLMAAQYGLTLDENEALMMRDAWRAVNPWAMPFGQELERAAISAVVRPGVWHDAGRVKYVCDDAAQWLWCLLPCGRFICYYQPRVELVTAPWGDELPQVTCVWGAAKPKVGEPWPRRKMYGGRFLENITQATAASLLRHAVVEADRAGVPVVLHVHDELIAEGTQWEDDIHRVMMAAPAWAEGLPLDVETASGSRYGK